ncbi:unnamed protein product, partial [Allacma fusca]
MKRTCEPDGDRNSKIRRTEDKFLITKNKGAEFAKTRASNFTDIIECIDPEKTLSIHNFLKDNPDDPLIQNYIRLLDKVGILPEIDEEIHKSRASN